MMKSAANSQHLEELKTEEGLKQIFDNQTLRFSTQPQNLTESDAEYEVTCTKHFFDSCVILQFSIKNSIEDQILSNVQLKLTNFESASGLAVQGALPLHEEDQIKFNEQRFTYIILSTQDSSTSYPTLKINSKLTFLITEIDVDSQEELGSYEEEFDQIQEL